MKEKNKPSILDCYYKVINFSIFMVESQVWKLVVEKLELSVLINVVVCYD